MPLRVGHCLHSLGLGGAQKVVASVVRASPRDAFQHFVYAGADGAHGDEIAEAGASVRVLPRRLPKFDPVWLAGLTRAMRRDRIDVVHTHLFGDSIHGYLAARLAGPLPTIVTLQISTEGLNRLQHWGYGWLLPRAGRVVACSEAVRHSFAAAFGARARDLIVVANGTEPPQLPELASGEREALRRGLGAEPGETLLACIGRLEPQKGLDDLIRAFAQLCRQQKADSRLVLVGDGSLRQDLERRARAEGVAGRVLFTGFREDIARLLPVVDVVVFSSLYEGLPVALVEAMAARRCIVATDVPGIVEAVRHECEALIVPIGRPERLAQALQRAVRDPKLRDRLGSHARERFMDRFTAAAMFESYRGLYLEVCGAGDRTPLERVPGAPEIELP